MTIQGVKEVKELGEIIKEFRDDELEHLNIAVENDAKKVFYISFSFKISLTSWHGITENAFESY